jgi:hypothetical protein
MNSPLKGKDRQKVSIVYKSRALGSDSSEGNVVLSKCYVNSTLLKSWSLRTGSVICLEICNEQYLFNCWPNKQQSQLTSDSVYLSKTWQPTFEGEEKKCAVNFELVSR